MKKFFVLLCLITGLSSVSIYAQYTKIYDEPEASFYMAKELFDNNKYSAASSLFNEIVFSQYSDNELVASSAYYEALCAAKLFNNNAEPLLNAFVTQYPEHSLASGAWLELARVQYNKKRYRVALESFSHVDFFGLKKDQVAEYHFKTGYCYLKTNDLKKAKSAFYEIKDTENLYQSPANYYYAHINFEEGNYETAQKSFTLLLDDPDFKKIAPHYLIRIFFGQEKYNEVIEMAANLNPKSSDAKSKEIFRLVGESYYQLGDYSEALSWLKNKVDAYDRNSWYELGYCYYKTNRFEEAIPCFENVTSPADSMAQNALYHLGECYIKADKKKFAGTAFKAAYAIKGNQTLREDALFNYAKLSYELSYDPYNEAIDAMQDYLADYPDSPRRDEAYSYLVNLFLVTKNYDQALISLEEISDKNLQMKQAYQKITYARGVELFKETQYDKAISFFEKSLIYKQDQTTAAYALFWEAEAFYRKQDYVNALKKYKSFMVTPGTYSLDVYPLATYNIAYCYFKGQDYTNALSNFRNFASSSRTTDIQLKADAYIRSGDCFFVDKRYNEAIEAYNFAIDAESKDKDYALYQKAITLGAMGNYSGKVWILKQLVKLPVKSPLRDDAVFELATTYVLMNEPDNALEFYQLLYTDYPRSSNAITALQKTGLIYYNQNKNDQAIAVHKKVIEQYPGSPEAKEALASLRNIYVDLGKVDEYFSYAKNISYADITYSEKDSVTYISVENKYMDGDCETAVDGFRRYLEQYPDGAFVVSAAYYKADCEYRSNNLADAVVSYEQVVAAPRSKFTENSLVKASSIRFAMEEYQQALTHFLTLQEIAEFPENIRTANIGAMRSYALLGEYEKAIDAALTVLNDKDNQERVLTEAHMTIARSAYALNDLNNASVEYAKVVESDRGELGAEAKYYVCLILFKDDKIEEAEASIFELIENYSSSNYWFARGFILLADVYVKTENYFQAKQTLQSIIDNYEGEDLIDEAKEKLRAVEEMEQMHLQQNTPADTLPVIQPESVPDTLSGEF